MPWDENIIVLGTNVLKRYIMIYNMDEQTVGVVDNKEYVQKLPIRKKTYSFLFIVSGIIGALVLAGIVMYVSRDRKRNQKERPDIGIALTNVNV